MKYIINLKEVSLKDINLVGGKNASLGEMIQNIESMGIKVPNLQLPQKHITILLSSITWMTKLLIWYPTWMKTICLN